jgi:hypothetical protein
MTTRKVIIKGARETLFINDQPSACPFRAGQLVQTSLGQTTFVNQCCDSSCPHFELDVYVGHKTGALSLYCTDQSKKWQVLIEDQDNHDLGNLSIHR